MYFLKWLKKKKILGENICSNLSAYYSHLVSNNYLKKSKPTLEFFLAFHKLKLLIPDFHNNSFDYMQRRSFELYSYSMKI